MTVMMVMMCSVPTHAHTNAFQIYFTTEPSTLHHDVGFNLADQQSSYRERGQTFNSILRNRGAGFQPSISIRQHTNLVPFIYWASSRFYWVSVGIFGVRQWASSVPKWASSGRSGHLRVLRTLLARHQRKTQQNAKMPDSRCLFNQDAQ
jgi:hypothetical protein